MRTQLFLGLILFACLDVGSLFVVARYFGVSGALFVVALSTLLGLLACARWMRRLAEHHAKLHEQYGEELPKDLVMIQGTEGLLTLLAVLCFLYPGLLSDALGFLLALPRIQEGSTQMVVEMLKTQAQKEGKTVAELFC